MSFLNAALRAVFDGLLYPFRTLPPVVGLAVISVPISIAMLLVFKATSDQDKLAAVKTKIHASLFEMRLFNDDLRAIARAQLDILRHNMTYFRLSLAPLVWMIVPFVLIVAQLQFNYGYSGLEPGARAVVKVRLAGEPGSDAAGEAAAAPRPGMELEVPAGLRVETPGVWAGPLREMAWRIVAEEPGDYEMTLSMGDEKASKTVRVSDQVVRRSPNRVGSGLWDQLIYPAEAPLPKGSAFEEILVDYPDAEVNLLGWRTHWLVVFFIFTIVFAFALRKRMGVTI